MRLRQVFLAMKGFLGKKFFILKSNDYILVAGGHAETKKNGRVSQHKTIAKVAAACEMPTSRGAKAWLFPRGFRPGTMSTRESTNLP